MSALSSGTIAPSITLPLLGGGFFELSAQLARSPVLLAFYKASCPTCQLALPIIERLHTGFPADALHVVGVSQDSEPESADFARRIGFSFPIALDAPRYVASNAYGLTNVPSIFLVAPEGTILDSIVGWSRAEMEQLNQRLATRAKASPILLVHKGEIIADFKPG